MVRSVERQGLWGCDVQKSIESLKEVEFCILRLAGQRFCKWRIVT
jgi:hypothetical protein